MFIYVDELEHASECFALSRGQFKELCDIHSRLRMKKSGKHYVLGLMQDDGPMIIIAILHERMALIKRLKDKLK